MKRYERLLTTLILIGLIVWLLCLLSCKSAQPATAENVSIAKVDTTKTATDSIAVERTRKISTDAVMTGSDSTIFEFADSGGSVTIDSAGNLLATGVKKMRIGAIYHKQETKATTATEKAARVNNKTDKGVGDKENRKTEKAGKPAGPKWYETALLWLCPICCIAVILWTIFLYIRRKF